MPTMFSQSLEEKYILEYFGDTIGTFISFGENDGETFSNVRALALRGWSGVCIEPSPTAFRKCKALYEGHKNIRVYPWAISSKFKNDGKAILHESGALLNTADVGLVSTFHASEMDRFKRTVSYTPVEVKTFKWKTALNRLQIREFDFVSLDVEGCELEILPDIDLTKTQMICIEHNGSQILKEAYEKYLEGFKLLYTSAENLIYAR